MFEKTIIDYANRIRNEFNYDFSDIEKRKEICTYMKEYFMGVMEFELDIFMAKMLNEYWKEFLEDLVVKAKPVC